MNLLKTFLSSELKLDPDKYISDFILYEKLLLDWNRKINLISRKSVSIEDHILNSIFFLTKFNLNNVKSIADIGSGGGFPGIPLKILFPEMKILLVDSIQKKVNVLNDILEKMNLSDIEAVYGRAEIISEETGYTNDFDIVISKAVSNLSNLYDWGNGFLNAEGKILCIKGGNLETELIKFKSYNHKLKSEVIEFNFENTFGIEDKKLVILKN